MTIECKQFLVSGRVQGVFFRASTQRQASELGLRGWVRNLRDGRVEVLACGEANVLEILEKWLETGPDYAKVTNIETINVNKTELPHTFEVRPTASTG